MVALPKQNKSTPYSAKNDTVPKNVTQKSQFQNFRHTVKLENKQLFGSWQIVAYFQDVAYFS